MANRKPLIRKIHIPVLLFNFGDSYRGVRIMTTLHELGLKELTSVQPGNYSVSLYTTGEKSVLVAWVIRRGRIDQPDTVQFNSQLLSTDGLSADQEQRCRHWYDCHIKARQIA